jgi:hypothetical protein
VRTKGAALRFLLPFLVVLILVVPISAWSGARSGTPNPSSLSRSPEAFSPSGAPTRTSDAPIAQVGTLSESMAWVPLLPSPPNATAGAGFAAVAGQGIGALFGGRTLSGLTNDTVVYNETQNLWTSLPLGTAPTARSDFGFAPVPATETAVLFGGEVNVTTAATSNETWEFSFLTDHWTNISGGMAPAPREDPAFSAGGGDALLYGGWNQNVSGTGEITYSDTWLLNLTTHVWGRVTGGGPTPGALHGASLLWQPTLGEYLLFGGCYPCSSAVWAFSPTSREWSELATGGPAPSPRMNAVWTWDPTQGIDLLFGGSDGTASFGDTYFFQPSTAAWTAAVTPSAPSPRTSSAADFLDPPGNSTLLLTGGSNGAGPLSDTWRLSAVANLTVEVTNLSSGKGIANATVQIGSGVPLLTNSTGFLTLLSVPSAETTVNVTQAGFAPGNRTLWVPPGASVTVVIPLTPLAPATVVVTVADPEAIPVGNASVSLTYDTRPLPGSPRLTNATGSVTFEDVPSANYTVSVSRTGFHAASERVDFPPGESSDVGLTLYPLFVLTVHTFGREPNGTVTVLAGVTVVVGNVKIGITGANGSITSTLNASGQLLVRGSVYGYGNATGRINATFTGSNETNLTLTAELYPVITIEVLGQRGHGPGFQVRDAFVNVTNSTSLPTGPFQGNFLTDDSGVVTFSPPAGNYSVHVAAVGYIANNSIPVIPAPPGAVVGRTIYLSLIGFSNISVLVLSTASGNPPVGDAHLSLNFTGVNLSTGLPFPSQVGTSLPSGWANLSGIPQSTVLWRGSATGYYPNNGSFIVVFGSPSNRFTIYLTPLPPPKYTGVRIFPSVPNAVWPLALLPVACLVGALVYLTMLRNPSGREREMREHARASRGGLDRGNVSEPPERSD